MRKKCKKCDKPATQGRFDGVFCDEHAKERDAKFAASVEEARKVGEAEARKEEERRAGANLHRLGDHGSYCHKEPNMHTPGNITVDELVVEGVTGYMLVTVDTQYQIAGILPGSSGSRLIAPDVHEANAARFVKCWNSHDELVDLAKEASRDLEIVANKKSMGLAPSELAKKALALLDKIRKGGE